MNPKIMETVQKIMELKKEVAELQHAEQPLRVDNHEFVTAGGTTSLADLFCDNDELLIIHNMGRSCPYCTLWADGLNGLLPHLESRSKVVMVSPDSPDIQAEFAASRGWSFKMVTDATKAFSTALGMHKEGEGFWPGASGLLKNSDGTILRKSWSYFGPGDDFCAVWPLLDLLPKRVNGWEPKYKY